MPDTYDANGNTLTDGQGRSFTWDFENRLVSATNPGVGTTTFKYDPFGRRIQKSGPLGTTNYLYDGNNLLEEIDQTGAVLVKYTENRAIDEPLAQLRSGNTAYYELDGLNSVTSLSSPVGALINTYAYDSYGKQTTSTGTFVNSLQYTGREFDSETGVYYYRARYYAPDLGRFATEDPFGAGGISQFAYTDNNPLKWVDPFGLYPRVPRCPSSRQNPTRGQLNSLIGPLSATDSANLDRGCIGMTSAYQGMNVNFPENAQGTKCFATEAQARARPCPSGHKFIFAKQGQYQNGAPTPEPNGEVPRNTISSAGGNYNYVVAFPGGCYGWMDHGVYPGAGPQHASIGPDVPDDEHYPHTIWCSTCCSKCMNSH